MDLSDYRVTGINNPAKQVSLTKWNDLLTEIEAGGVVTPQMYGAVGDDVTDDGPAFIAALAALKAAGDQSYAPSIVGAKKLFIPLGRYYLGTSTLDIRSTLIIEGESGGWSGGEASVLRWADGVPGIRIHHTTTSGDYGIGANEGQGAGSIIRNLHLYGGYSGAESESHGIVMRAACTLDQLWISGWSGDAINARASQGAGATSYTLAPEGNINAFRIMNVGAYECRNGLYIDGADANAGTTVGFYAKKCRQWGIWDSSFLGNTHVGPTIQNCGNTAGTTPCWVENGGNLYACIMGQEVGASTNAPSGTTSDNTWWTYISAGSANAGVNRPAWLSGTTYRAGGAFATDNANARVFFLGCYTESGQPPSQCEVQTQIMGGQIGAGVSQNSQTFWLLGRTVKSTLTLEKAFAALSSSNSIGPQSGTATPSTVYIDHTSTNSDLYFRSWSGGSPQQDGRIRSIRSSGQLNVQGATSASLGTTGVGNKLTVDATKVDIASGHYLAVNGTQVVTARQTGTAANATDLATAITLVNDLKAKLVAHGLIS